ncbi:RsmE family RNA methyltransferase [Clostridium aminobutyricum]|uniref:Ribosomal RNA small subunit methyltransferase E n=1 Tax=Clostridium aminobutyricum TaxID=33953 RepID=A0A939IIP3_CLOAM|nr:16S rRNA (uracil(1498)-N(3))-methyltransferase [Clostridium aminobutyricum]MBN7772709.1 16S rRNA (uracil(1498)-N(3))-methyltransferase [Clostridium aminobutyricum]
MSRFFTSSENIGEKSIRITDKNDIHHIAKVLRLKIGDKIELSDSVKWEYETEISFIDKDYVEAVIIDKQKFANEPKTKVTLFQGVPKQGKMELIIQKNVELGVYEIVPVFTDRTVVTDNGKFSKKIERWQKVSDEAVKQCKRGIIPMVSGDISFKEMLERLGGFELVLFPYENEEDRTIKDALRNLEKIPETVAIIIGPEGGFSEQEAQRLRACNAECVTLGKTTLRTETAGIAALAMTMYELEL